MPIGQIVISPLPWDFRVGGNFEQASVKWLLIYLKYIKSSVYIFSIIDWLFTHCEHRLVFSVLN